MKLWKYSGTYLTVTGIIHTVAGLIMGCNIYQSMLKDGLIDSIGDDFTRGFGFWFLICGVALVLLGTTLQHYIRATQKPAPLFLGWSILIFSVVGCLIVPVSGFWLFLPQAIIIIAANHIPRKAKKP